MRQFIIGLVVGAVVMTLHQRVLVSPIEVDPTMVAAAGMSSNCPADLNNSGAVDVQDLLLLLGSWGPCPEGCQSAQDCGPNQICVANACVCAAGYADCDGDPNNGCEVWLEGDANHCGCCNCSCGFDAICVNGACTGSGGCQSARDCGPNQICVGSACVCAANYADCDGDPSNGCEAWLVGDANHCGCCNCSCGFDAICVNGACTTP